MFSENEKGAKGRKMKVIYIAGKYQGKTHDGKSFAEIHGHIMAARAVAIEVWKLGAVALCPHLNSWHMEIDCDANPETFYRGDVELVHRSDALMLVSNWRESRGARMEKELAESLGLPVFEDIAHLREWLLSEAAKANL